MSTALELLIGIPARPEIIASAAAYLFFVAG